MEKSPLPVTGSLTKAWKSLTAAASAEEKLLVKETGRWLRTMPAENSCTQTPVEPVDTVWSLRPDRVPGPKTPLATPSAMPSEYWTANSMDLATSREWCPSQGMM